MARETWIAIAVVSTIAIPAEVWLGISLWFSPGWANGWPFGLSKRTVWPFGMAALLSLLPLTLAAAVGAIFGYFFSWIEEEEGRRWVLRAYIYWFAISAVLASLWGYYRFWQMYGTV